MPNLAQSQTNNNGLLICSTLEVLLSLYDPLIYSLSYSVSSALEARDMMVIKMARISVFRSGF